MTIILSDAIKVTIKKLERIWAVGVKRRRILVNKEVSHFIDILFARCFLRLTSTARILSSSLIYKESWLV